MAMTTAELQRYLDPKKIGSAPILVKLGVLLVVLAGIVAASWAPGPSSSPTVRGASMQLDGLRPHSPAVAVGTRKHRLFARLLNPHR